MSRFAKRDGHFTNLSFHANRFAACELIVHI